MATANLGRVVGSKWYVGDKITGTSTTPTIFSDSGISRAYTQDLYLNSSTDNVYECTTAGTASEAKWAYVCNIKGNQPALNNTLYSTSTTQALTAKMGKTLFDKLLDSGVYAQEIIIDNTNKVYSITTTVENKDSTLTFVSTSNVSKTYSVTKSGNAETQTLTITMQSLGFGSSGVVLSNISSTENIYSVTLKNSGGTAIVTIDPNLWDKLNELDQQVRPGGSITDGAETLKEGVISRLINGVKTVLYPITHAKAVWFDKSNNMTVNDKFTANDNNIAPTENGATASQTLNAGSYILRNNQLYKVTTTIASGSAITEGVNIESAAVGGELTNLSIKKRTMTITTGNTGDAVIFQSNEAPNVLPFMIKCETPGNFSKFEIYYNSYAESTEGWIVRATLYSTSEYIVRANETFTITVYYYELN